MIPIGDEELIQRELDRENTAEVSARLRGRLAEEPELRRRYERLQGVVRAVSRLPWIEAPGDLAADVLADLRRRAPAPSRMGLARPGRGRVWQPVLAYGSALAAGLLLGAFLFGAGDLSRQRSDAALSGAALPQQTIAQLPGGHSLHLAEGPLRANALWRPTPDGVRVELEIEAEGPVDGTLRFDPSALRPRAVELGGVPAGETAVGPGQVQLRQVGAGTYAVVLEGSLSPSASGLYLRLESRGRVVEGRLGLVQGGGPES